jgi:transcriptional regulator with XRE-family HTH domain
MENNVNQRVKLLRKTLGISQEKFANELELSLISVNRMEKGSEVSLKTVKKIVEKFGISEKWLSEGIGELEVNLPIKEEVYVNPYKDALVRELKEEVDFLRQLLKNITGTSQSVRANFNDDTVPALNFNENLSLQFVQYRESA